MPLNNNAKWRWYFFMGCLYVFRKLEKKFSLLLVEGVVRKENFFRGFKIKNEMKFFAFFSVWTKSKGRNGSKKTDWSSS